MLSYNALYQTHVLSLQVIDDFVKSIKGTDISIISQEIFENDPLTRLENLKVQLSLAYQKFVHRRGPTLCRRLISIWCVFVCPLYEVLGLNDLMFALYCLVSHLSKFENIKPCSPSLKIVVMYSVRIPGVTTYVITLIS